MTQYLEIFEVLYLVIDNFGIYPGDYTRHHNCTFEVFEMQYALKKMDAKNEKEKILKLIEFIRGNFKLVVYEDKSSLYEEEKIIISLSKLYKQCAL